MSDSAYVSLKPVYNSTGTAMRTPGASKLNPAPDSMLKSGNLRSVPSTKENAPVTQKDAPSGVIQTFKNDIYDNVNIDQALPDGESASFCDIDEAKKADDIAPGDDSKPPAKAPSAWEEAQLFFDTITKKQWMWAGGITAGLLILRKGKN